VLLLQEGAVRQPIDYRDVVSTYASVDHVQRLLERPFRQIFDLLQSKRPPTVRAPARLLERLDLGDVAAENEILGLREYFVRTAQYNDARRGYARLLVGRKGSGKTAIFYAIRDSFGRSRSHLILDFKPEGHQFVRLREAILSSLSPGLQEYVLIALWNYLLLVEIALKITDADYETAQRDRELWPRFERLQRLYAEQEIDESGDFSERLLQLVERMSKRFSGREQRQLTASELTELLFRGDIRALDDAVAAYLERK
jgi:hypothetical protein